MAIAQNILWVLVLIGVMILIHELGHYWAARIFNVRIDVFSFGFGPRLFGFRRGETDFRFSLILFGGFVKMAGEQPGEETAADPRSLLNKPRWQRLVIAFSGPGMNLVLAVALLTGLFMVKFQKPPDVRAVVGHVFADSAAARAGIREGDRIVALNEHRDPTWDDVAVKEVAGAGQPLQVLIERDGKQFWTTVTPVFDERSGLGYAGWQEQTEIQIAGLSPGMPAEKAGLEKGDVLVAVNGQPIRSRFRTQEIIRVAEGKPVEIRYLRQGREASVTIQPVFASLDGPARWMIGVSLESRLIITRLSLPEALRESVVQNIRGASLIYQFLRGIIERRMSAKTLQGPIGIARVSGEAAREGPSAFLAWMAIVSLQLAIFNLLPIPVLDGGVIMLLLVEMVMRRDLSLAVKEAVFKLGFVFLMAVVVFALYNDISKMLPAG
jgi:regulator of sigma E protease